MSITTPPEYQVVPAAQLLGRREFDAEPLDTVLENVNWLYKNYTPPLYNACVQGGAATYLAPRDVYFPLNVSADSISYTLYAYIWTSASSTVALEFYESSTVTTGTPWGTTTATDTYSAGIGGRYVSTDLGSLTSTTKFGRCVFTPQISGTPTCQVQWVMIVPTPSAVTAGLLSSGVIAYDGAHLNGTGSAIHTEYADRALQNIARIVQDRDQCVFSYQELATSTSAIATRGDQTTRLAAIGQTHLHGQHGSTCTVYMRASDAGTATVEIAERGTGNVVTLAADDTDVSDTITFTSTQPTIAVTVKPDSGTTFRYLVITWSPASMVEL